MTDPSLSDPIGDRFFHISVDLLCVVGQDGCFARLNPAWERTLGYPTAELLGRQVVELIHPDDVGRTRELSTLLQTGQDVTHFENRYRHKNGSYRWISWTCAAIREGESLLYGIGRDVTEHRDAEEQLLRKTTELEAVFKALPDLLFRTDEADRIVAHSAGRAADLYAPPGTFLGRTFLEVLPPDLGPRITAAIERARQGGELETLEYELAVPAGLQRFEARVMALRDGHTITVVRNVTARWLAERALAASEARLRESERLEAIGRLAGGIAHDFNNLMMIVLMQSDTLLRATRVDDPNRTELLEIHGAGQRATGLTRQLLAFARRQMLSPSVLDPGLVVRDMERMLRGVVGERIELAVDVAVGSFRVRVDPSQLEQVVLNLVLNARDAMPDGGRLGIELDHQHVDAAGATRLDVGAAGPYVRLIVRDTGGGIDPGHRPHIFEPFFTTKGRASGTGLGLATVYGIVRQSGGGITVDSELGEGTAFIVALPSAEGQPLAAGPARVDGLPRGRETLLVVEDDAAVRRAVVTALENLGYTVLQAGGADEALRQVDEHGGPIDLLLTDVVMPGASGPRLAKAFLMRRPHARVVYMSGYSADTDSGEWPAGPRLEKPFSPDSLAVCIRRTLDGGQPA